MALLPLVQLRCPGRHAQEHQELNRKHPSHPRVERHGGQGSHSEGGPQAGVLPVAHPVCSMDAFTADEPQEERHPPLVSLRQRAFRKGIQGKDWGIQSAFLEGKIACLQFVDDTTLFAHSKQEMVALFEQYSSFSRSYRISVNWGKCSVMVLCEQDAEELEAEKARLKQATAQ